MYYVPTSLKVRASFKLLEMIDLCILFNTSLHLFPNNWLRNTSIELDRVILYSLNCCLISSVGAHTSTSSPRLSSLDSGSKGSSFPELSLSSLDDLLSLRQLCLAPCKGIQIPESRKFLHVESGILDLGIQNPTNNWDPQSKLHRKRSGIQLLESGIHGGESRIQDCLRFPYIGRSFGPKIIIFRKHGYLTIIPPDRRPNGLVTQRP